MVVKLGTTSLCVLVLMAGLAPGEYLLEVRSNRVPTRYTLIFDIDDDCTNGLGTAVSNTDTDDDDATICGDSDADTCVPVFLLLESHPEIEQL